MKKPVDLSIFEPARFDAVSSVVGHVAHDINNLLTPLLAYPFLIKGELSADSPALELVDVIEKTARDMVHMNKQLLALASGGDTTRQVFDLNGCASDAVVRMEREGFPPAKVQVVSKLAGEPVNIEGRYEHVLTAIQNLCTNAAEAMPEGGTIEISSCVVRHDSRISDSGLLVKTGTYAAVKVSDTGDGVPGDLKLKIFDPFVTSKKGVQKRGSGLGLSIAYRIMMEHDGFIDFTSEKGKGSTFTLCFPVQAAVAETPREVPASAGGLQQSDKRKILIVDDEKTILKLFQLILMSAIPDLKVDLAGNGQEAVEAFSREHHSILMMDLHMPVLDGKAAYFEIEQICREKGWQVPSVIFCTGFAFPDTVRSIVAANPNHCLLSKPVGSDILIETVKKRLHA